MRSVPTAEGLEATKRAKGAAVAEHKTIPNGIDFWYFIQFISHPTKYNPSRSTTLAHILRNSNSIVE